MIFELPRGTSMAAGPPASPGKSGGGAVKMAKVAVSTIGSVFVAS